MSVKFPFGATGACFVNALDVMDSLASIHILYPLCLIYIGFWESLNDSCLDCLHCFSVVPTENSICCNYTFYLHIPSETTRCCVHHAIRERGGHVLKAQGQGFCFFGLHVPPLPTIPDRTILFQWFLKRFKTATCFKGKNSTHCQDSQEKGFLCTDKVIL